MTVCLATLCDEGGAIVLVADKMVGKIYIEAEMQITKLQLIHPQWFMMMAGDDLSPLFDLADLARSELLPTREASVETVMEVLQRNYELIGMNRAEAQYLKPIGWTIDRFTREGGSLLPNFLELQSKLQEHELPVEILVAGFDRNLVPPGKIFTMSSINKGIPARCDIPGFAAIGSGATVAEYMMFYRDVSQKLPIRAAVYYALEAKYFGEQASGVSTSTDMFVLQFVGTLTRVIQIDDGKTIEKKLIPICERLEPSDPTDADIDILNGLKELEGLPKLPKKRKKPRKGK
jgi:20S proteasome alpha/beta subunit